MIYRTIVFLVFISACSSDRSDQLFTTIDKSESGLDFSNDLTDTEDFNIIDYLYFYNGGGVAVGDINNDTLPDIFFTSNQGKDRLYLNKGDFKFENITDLAFDGLSKDWSTGVTMADVNNDGWLDIYVSSIGAYEGQSGRNQLWLNNKDNTFSDIGQDANLDLEVLGTQAAFFDYDRDGDLDVYILCHNIKGSDVFKDVSIRSVVDVRSGDRLMKNQLIETGDLRFEDVTTQSGIYQSGVGFGLGISIADINNDGWSDVLVGNDFHENDYIYLNNQNGTFTESANELMPHGSTFSMGNDIADINNDGLLDIVTLDMKPEDRSVFQNSTGVDAFDVHRFKLEFGYEPQYSQNSLFVNRGESFSEVSNQAGISSTDWSWSVLMEDFDLDGMRDVFISNGIVRRPNDQDYLNYLSSDLAQDAARDLALIEAMPDGAWTNYFYRNTGNTKFDNVTSTWSSMIPDFSTGAAVADFDLDGDLDIVANRINDEALLLKNNTKDQNYLIVDCDPSWKSRFLGAKVSVHYRDTVLIDEVKSSRGFQSASEPIAHFGLGDYSGKVDVEIRLGEGSKRLYTDVTLNQRMFVGNGPKGWIEPWDACIIFFAAELNIRHHEDKFTDFTNQKLLPFSQATAGPAMASGDVNGDGHTDLFIGNAKSFKNELFLGNDKNDYLVSKNFNNQTVNLNDAADATFCDLDGDTDLDLVVVYGGNELLSVPIKRNVRLFLNDGKGTFTENMDHMPALGFNGKCVRSWDYDNDGDIDLFIGASNWINYYGVDPTSVLLINNGSGDFTENKLSELKLGMVNDARWSDIDGDGRADLIVGAEWRDIQILLNKESGFVSTTIPNTSGLWRSIAVDDVNDDGIKDIVAGNIGLNLPLKASEKYPLTMYVGDFNGNGATQSIICQYDNDSLYTYEDRVNLSSQIPWIKKKYPDFGSFANATARDIFELALDGIPKMEVSEMRSMIYLGKGTGGYAEIPLPDEAQYSCINAIAIDDFNRDGRKDIMTGGNLYEITPSLGRLDGSYGEIYFQNSNGSYDYDACKSNIGIRGQVRKIISIDNGALIGLNNDAVKLINF